MVWVCFGGDLGVDLGGFGGGLVWKFLGLCGCGGGLGGDFGFGVDVSDFWKKNEEKKWVWEDEDGGFGDPVGLGR